MGVGLVSNHGGIMSQPKPETKTIQTPNPETRTEDDRYSTPSNPGKLSQSGERKRDGDRLANDVEQKGSAAPRSDTAQRDSEVNSFDATRSREGGQKGEV